MLFWYFAYYYRRCTLFQKELRQFFSSLIGYIGHCVFLLWSIYGLVCPESNILDAGYASWTIFFYVAPFILWCWYPLSPCGHSLRDAERHYWASGYPSAHRHDIIFGKFFAALALVLAAYCPDIGVFLYHLSSRCSDRQCGRRRCHRVLLWIDIPECGYSYPSAFHLIGLPRARSWRSSVWCFHMFYPLLCYRGPGQAWCLLCKSDYLVEQIGLTLTMKSIGRGIVDTKDVVYFLSIIALSPYLPVHH